MLGRVENKFVVLAWLFYALSGHGSVPCDENFAILRRNGEVRALPIAQRALLFPALATLPLDAQARAAIAFPRLTEAQRLGFIARAVDLVASGHADQLLRLLSTMEQASRATATLALPSSRDIPRVQQFSREAAAAFLADPREVLDHLTLPHFVLDTNGTPRRHVLTGGQHTTDATSQFLRVWLREFLSDSSARSIVQTMMRAIDEARGHRVDEVALRRFLEGVREELLSTSLDEGLIALSLRREEAGYRLSHSHLWSDWLEAMDRAGFDRETQALLRIFYGEIRVQVQPNGVVNIQFPRNAYSGNAWGLSRRAAEAGLAPSGGKTLFPKEWDRTRIEGAILQVLRDPTSEVRSYRELPSGIPFYYLAGTVDGVRIALGMQGNRVVTAFPVWEQQPRSTVGAVYERFHGAEERLRAHAIWLRDSLHVPLLPPSDLRAIYLGRDPTTPLTAEQRTALDNFLRADRLRLAVGQRHFDAVEVHAAIAESLLVRRQAQDIESLQLP